MTATMRAVPALCLLAALAACEQSGSVGEGGQPAPDTEIAADPMNVAAEAEADPANTLENQAAALNEAASAGGSAGNEAATQGTNAQSNAQ